jgi:uncharacterized damage-inducible protein DinB
MATRHLPTDSRRTTVLPLTTFRELFAYNYWARDRQLEACSSLSQDEFQRPLGNSFPSMRDTLAHMVGAEWIWLERLQGRSPKALPQAAEFPALATVAERWRVVEHGFLDYLRHLREEQLASTIAYTNFQAQTWSYPVGLILLHLINHQTYHRGQVTTLLRQLGLSAPAIDLLVAEDRGLFEQAPVPGRQID